MTPSRDVNLNKSDRILVTGAAGLMGSALVDHLRAEGYENVIPLARADCDLVDTAATFAEFERRRPDHVFHAAARVYGIRGSLKNQGPLFYDNCMMNTNVVEASRRAGVRKVTVMGTGAVYPFPSPGLPLKEDMIFLGRPHSAHAGYANAKLAMLAMLEAYQDSYGLKWAYIVSANLFGPRDRFDTETGNVVPSLIKKFHDAKTERRQPSPFGATAPLSATLSTSRMRRGSRSASWTASTGRSTWAAAKSTAYAMWSTRSPRSRA